MLLPPIPSIDVDKLISDTAVVITDENVSNVSTAVTESFDCEPTSVFVDKGTSVNDDSVSAASVNQICSGVSVRRVEFLLEPELSFACVCSSVK